MDYITKSWEICKVLEKYKDNVKASILEINDLDITCFTVLQYYLNIEIRDSSALPKIQAVIDYMHEKINVGNWKEVKPFLRKTITIASYLKILAIMINSDNLTDDLIKEIFKVIDFGLMFGCPLEKEPCLLQNCASIITSKCFIPIDIKHNLTINLIEPPQNINCLENNVTPLEIIDCPSMEYFYKNIILTDKPVILENCIKHWPALTKWKDQSYFIKMAGLRTVSIEIGSKYTDSDWTQKLMTIEQFIKHHIYDTEGPVGYLAQYQLFEQIPELKKDIFEPEYCCFSESNEPVDIMAWYGPKGTVSPLHHDPKKNLLAQVVGEKKIYLFSPEDSENLYPHEHELLNNTAQIDPRKPDLENYPKYKEAKPYYCILRPGQMLYIPPKWWHFVESLSISFSVSFWWE